MISNDGRYLVFTEGEQESLNTDVILYDFLKDIKLLLTRNQQRELFHVSINRRQR